MLTGQYNRYRASTNSSETTLAQFNSTSASSFGLANFYKVTSTPPAGFNYEPIIAQPLYATKVPTSGGPKNLLIVASLNDQVYAFDTANPSVPLWSVNLAMNDCGSTGLAFSNIHSHNPGGANLPYYGIVATPVIDTLPSTPIIFVVSACIQSAHPTQILWWLDALSASTGADFASVQIANPSFNSSYQVARTSLLVTHPTGTSTDLYFTFGTGVGELQAATSCGSACAYSGVLFGYTVGYHTMPPYVTFSNSTLPPFYTSCGTTGTCPTNVFPSVNTGFNTSNPPTGPANCVGSSGCDQGDNWAVNGGGIWMSSVGAASTSSADVYVAAGNGPFACTGSGPTCTNASSVQYWGESAIKFPAANASNPMKPADFFAPYVERYTTNKVNGDPSPATYQTQELSRLDLDFGSSGVVIIPEPTTFAMTADKSGYLYVMPAESNSLGSFQTSDQGLTGGTVTTQPPFQLSRLPTTSNYTTVCPVNVDSLTWQYSGPSCDEIHELAFWAAQNLLFVWPIAESVEAFQGAYSSTSYTFGTSPSFDPCLTPGNCSGTAPAFPRSNPNSEGGTMALAVDNTLGVGTLWGIVPRQNSVTPIPSYVWGWLYAYAIGSGGALTHVWDSGTGHNCASPPATGWFTTSFTEPTLANGAAFVPTVCAVTDGNQYQDCSSAGSAAASGVLVFSTCP